MELHVVKIEIQNLYKYTTTDVPGVWWIPIFPIVTTPCNTHNLQSTYCIEQQFYSVIRPYFLIIQFDIVTGVLQLLPSTFLESPHFPHQQFSHHNSQGLPVLCFSVLVEETWTWQTVWLYGPNLCWSFIILYCHWNWTLLIIHLLYTSQNCCSVMLMSYLSPQVSVNNMKYMMRYSLIQLKTGPVGASQQNHSTPLMWHHFNCLIMQIQYLNAENHALYKWSKSLSSRIIIRPHMKHML